MATNEDPWGVGNGDDPFGDPDKPKSNFLKKDDLIGRAVIVKPLHKKREASPFSKDSDGMSDFVYADIVLLNGDKVKGRTPPHIESSFRIDGAMMTQCLNDDMETVVSPFVARVAQDGRSKVFKTGTVADKKLAKEWADAQKADTGSPFDN